jgi:hypothetical protein
MIFLTILTGSLESISGRLARHVGPPRQRDGGHRYEPRKKDEEHPRIIPIRMEYGRFAFVTKYKSVKRYAGTEQQVPRIKPTCDRVTIPGSRFVLLAPKSGVPS